MRVLLTGSAGALGQRTLDLLSKRGHEVVAFDNRTHATLPEPSIAVAGDVRDSQAVLDAARNCHVGVHLAALHTGDAASILAVNVAGAYSFFAAAQTCGFRMAVHASSAIVHMSPGENDAEVFPLPVSVGRDHAYDLSKALQEQIAKDFFDGGVHVRCLRLGHIVDGERRTDLHGTQRLEDLRYCRGGWLAIEDAAEALVAALFEPDDHIFQPYNIVGSRSGRLRFRVAESEKRLGIGLKHDFAEFE